MWLQFVRVSNSLYQQIVQILNAVGKLFISVLLSRPVRICIVSTRAHCEVVLRNLSGFRFRAAWTKQSFEKYADAVWSDSNHTLSVAIDLAGINSVAVRRAVSKVGCSYREATRNLKSLLRDKAKAEAKAAAAAEAESSGAVSGGGCSWRQRFLNFHYALYWGSLFRRFVTVSRKSA